MTLATSAQYLLVASLLITALPAVSVAKPNSFPGENSTYKADPAETARREAERAKRIKERKKRREERRLKRLNKKNNRLN